jgi:integrase
VPFVRHLSEAGNARQGFFAEADFQNVVSNLPDYLKDFVRFAYLTGMRKGEIASLRWDDVDGDSIRLRAENTKNGEGRTVPIEGELAELIDRRNAARQVRKPDLPITLSAWIFHRSGEPIGDFRKAWATACVMAGLGQWVCPTCERKVDAEHKCADCSREWTRDELKYQGRIFHDFRRTAVRDMVRAGVPETVAMSISGHKTRSMFDRYNIHDERDQREALRATQAYREQQAALQRERVATMPAVGRA